MLLDLTRSFSSSGCLSRSRNRLNYRRHRHRFSAFVARERIVSAAGQTCRSNLAKAEFAPDAPDFFTLLFSFTKYQFVTGRRIAPCAIGIKLHFSASAAAPPRQPHNFNP